MWKRLVWWRVDRSRARAEAHDLVTRHGPLAYYMARRIARAERQGRLIDIAVPTGHWELVRQEIKRLEGRL